MVRRHASRIVLLELGLERMTFDDELGDRTWLDAILERHRRAIVANVSEAAHARLVKVLLLVFLAQAIDVVLPRVKLERFARLEFQQRQ